MGRTRIRRIVVGIGGFTAAILMAFAWLGYLGGDPFTILPVKPGASRQATSKQGDVAAVVLSGDMGFRLGMGPQIAERLLAHGIPVIGVNSLTAFRTTRTPAQATALIEAAMRKALALGHTRRIVLIGQSYGSDMLHVGLAGLPQAMRDKVPFVALLVPGATVEYRASPSEMLTFAMAESDALPTARKLNWVPVLCVYGVQEPASLCPLLHQRNIQVVGMPGGHPLHYDADGVYARIAAELRKAGIS
jgi:type IV secretory pathway VirJ component